MRKIGVIGCRFFEDSIGMSHILNALKPFHLVSGGAKGADSLAEKYADSLGYPKTIHRAKWHKYRKGAGPKRNSFIVRDSEFIIAFLAPDSTGTADCIKQANKAGIFVLVVHI